MKNHQYLTKLRFKLGIGCPAKLYYTRKQECPNQKVDDFFLKAIKGMFSIKANVK